MASMKIKYGTDVRRVPLEKIPSYEEMALLVRNTYKLTGDFVIKYEDQEFDLVTVASDEDMRQAAQYAGRTSGVLRFEVFDIGNTEQMRSSRILSMSQFMSDSGCSITPPPASDQSLNQLFNLDALKRLFCNFEIDDFITRLKTLGFLNANQEQLDYFVNTMQSMIQESAAILKHSSGRIQEEGEVHEGILCDNCQSKIAGVRYKCAFCFNYDLCSRCEALGVHDVAHPRLKIAKPVDGVIEQCAWSAQQSVARYNAQLVKTSTSDCISVGPRRSFVKTWRIRNNGPRSWPSHCSLSFVDGSSFSAVADVPIFTCVAADQEIDISVEMVSPSMPGRYQCFWCLKTPEGNYFGEKLWCDLLVLPSTPTLPSFIADGPAHLMEYELKNIGLKDRTVNAQGTNAPIKESEQESLKVLQDMGFTGDLLTIIRKNKGDIADTIHELIVE